MSGRPDPIRDTLRDAVDESFVADVWARVERGPKPSRAPLLIAAAAAVLALVALVWPRPDAALRAGRATVLADGTEVRLSSDARFELVADDAARFELALSSGTVWMDVRPGARRWIVDAALAHVEVLGTRFSVARLEDRVDVAVERGVVQVDSAHLSNTRRLRAGERISIAPREASAGRGGGDGALNEDGSDGRGDDGARGDDANGSGARGADADRIRSGDMRGAEFARGDGRRGSASNGRTPTPAPDADRRTDSNADRGARSNADRGAGSNADRGAGSNADRGARSNANRGARSNADRRAGSNADRGAGSNADRRARSNADRGARSNADQRARSTADRRTPSNADASSPGDDRDPPSGAPTGPGSANHADAASSAPALLEAADAARARGDEDAAVDLLARLLEGHPASNEAGYAATTLARIQWARGERADAIVSWERAIEAGLPNALEREAYRALLAAHRARRDRAAYDRVAKRFLQRFEDANVAPW